MLVQELVQGRRSERKYRVRLARDEAEIREAQKLRYRVFAGEIGARLSSLRGIDEDEFDAYCEHLLVRDEASGEVVGTYRILAPEEAQRIGRLYSEREFDLGRLAHLKPCMTEVGRSCIHPAFRNGTVIALLWAGLARYMVRNGYEYLIGCRCRPTRSRRTTLRRRTAIMSGRSRIGASRTPGTCAGAPSLAWARSLAG